MIVFALLFLFWLAPSSSLACASCGCTLSSDWGDTQQQGFKLDLRYDFIDQSQLRTGTTTISPEAASKLVNGGGSQEVEVRTRNTYLTAGLDYQINDSWSIAALLPYIMRDHSTLGTASDGVTGGPGGGQYDSSTSNFGDAKILARYLGLTPQHNLSFLFGFKLPTGSHTLVGTSTDPSSPGPVPIDRGLQPGSGTTDAIVGLTYTEALNKNWDYFTEVLAQTALTISDQYRPGDGYNFNFGFRYMGYDFWKPQAQLNARYVERDSGAAADQFSTGGTLLYFSPGAFFPVGGGVELYAFFQVPLYQNLQGVQLAPLFTASLGARYVF
jgi:hypothetical protein